MIYYQKRVRGPQTEGHRHTRWTDCSTRTT